MATHKYIVKVPKPDPKSYDPNRRITGLVQNQIFHLSLAEQHLSRGQRSGVDIYSLGTEGQAAEYIAHLTSKLHPEGAKQPGLRRNKSAASKPGNLQPKRKAKRKN